MKSFAWSHTALTPLTVATVGLLAACGSGNSPAPGTGGAPGGGTGGVLGANGGSGGGSGSTGRDCTTSNWRAAPTDGLIADFTDADAGINLGGSFFPYPQGSPAAPTFTTTGGILHVTENAPATSAAQYLGLTIAFGGCVDATAFTGVKFSISGSISGCALNYSTCDVEHQDVAFGSPLATGPAGSYQPYSGITEAQLTPAPQTLMMPFMARSPGNPATPLDPTKLIFVLWQFNVDPVTAGGESACIADLTIDDVMFY
jgi:hypothetical protein